MQTNDDRPSGAPGTPGEAAGGSVREWWSVVCDHGLIVGIKTYLSARRRVSLQWPSHQFVRDVIETTIHNHPKDCIFKSGAINRATTKVLGSHERGDRLIDAIERAIKSEELYCPHEGINRLPNIEEMNG